MSSTLVNLSALTLFVPKAMAVNKPDSLVGAYRREAQIRCHPGNVTVKAATCSDWSAVHTTLAKDDEGKVIRDEKGNPTEKVEAVTIPSPTRSAMIRQWRQRAIGLRG